MIYVYMFVFVLKVWIWEQVAKVSSPRLTRSTWITVTLIPRRRRWRGKDTFLVIWDLWRHWRIKALVSFVKQFEELSETRKNLPFHKAVSWKCPIRVFEWSIEVNHGYIQDLKVLLKFLSSLYLFFPFFLTNGTLCFFQKNQGPCHDYFYSLKNVSFCAFHPRDHRYLGFITKHPTLQRFACHVFIGQESTRPVAEAVGYAFPCTFLLSICFYYNS